MRKLLPILLVLAAPSIMAAQRTGSGHFSGRGAGFNHQGYRRSAHYPVPLYDPFYSDYVSDAVYQSPSQPVVPVMQPESATAPEPAPPAPPLMIELQDGRYVQISGNETSQSETIDRVGTVSVGVRPVAAVAPPRPPSTVLVFRDGHRQEIFAYTIADGTLYAASDYYSSGAWNQTIALSALFLPETIAANQQRGVQFRLPTSPNEVIVGP